MSYSGLGYPGFPDEETTAQGGATCAQGSHGKDAAELGFQAASLSYLKGEKKISASPHQAPRSHAQTPRPHTFLPPREPLLLPGVSAPPGRRGSGRHRKGEGAAGGDREKARVGWGGRVCHQPVPGCVPPKLGAQKLLLFTPQLCGSRRQSRACPGLGLDFSTRRSLAG